jgi:hypothetical protein
MPMDFVSLSLWTSCPRQLCRCEKISKGAEIEAGFDRFLISDATAVVLLRKYIAVYCYKPILGVQ